MKTILENFAIRQCEMCGLKLEELTSEEDKEMKEEYAGNFPDDPEMKEDVALICDDCYKKLGLE